MTNKNLYTLGGGVAVLMLGWLGGSAYLAQQTESQLKAAIEDTSGNCSVRIDNLQHHQNLLSSQGEFGVRIGDQCNSDPNLRDWLTGRVTYRIQNLILPTSAARFTWAFEQTVQDGSDAASAFKLSGKGASHLSGAIESDIQSPPFAGYSENGNWRMEPLSGSVEWANPALKLTLASPRFVGRGDGEALDIQAIDLRANLSDAELGLGDTAFTIDKIGTSTGSGQGFSISAVSKQNADKIDSSITYSLNAFNAMGYSGHDLILALGISGLHADSLRTLTRIAEESPTLDNLTDDEKQQLRSALRALLNQGLRLSIDKLSGSMDSNGKTGRIDGNLNLTVKPNSDASKTAIRLADVVESSGQIRYQGNVLEPAQTQELLATGFAIDTGNGLSAHYDYSAGMLKANDRAFDAQTVLDALKGADEYINAFLDGRLDPAQLGPSVPDAEPTDDEADESQDDASDADDAGLAEPAASEDAEQVAAQPMILNGVVSYSSENSVIQDAQGNRILFPTHSTIGKQIMDNCREGQPCIVDGTVAFTDAGLQLMQLNSVESRPVEPEPPTPQASFDCAQARTAVEKLICASPALSAADGALALRYQQAVAAGGDVESLVAQQKAWLKQVRNVCTDAPCLETAYQVRLQDLSTYP